MVNWLEVLPISLTPTSVTCPRFPRCKRVSQVKSSKRLGDLKRWISLANHECQLEEALRKALKSVLSDAGPGANPRTIFHNKFQREIEEHDQDLEKKYDEDLNTSLIFVSIVLLKKL